MSQGKQHLEWTAGRQATGYQKLLLLTARWPLPFDLYLLRFPPGSHLPPHVDPVDERRHYRLNLVVKRAQRGGEFSCARALLKTRRLALFRPDRDLHGVSEVLAGNRYVLSLGWVRPRSE